jgi:pimeloyl-ACP methyl ester carboxylesterase
VVHQIIQTLRAGQRPESSLGKAILVGISNGSGVAVIEANRYADVDGLILTGLLHTYAPTASLAGALFYPAARDPHFAHRHVPPGYATSLPGALAVIALYSPNTDADVMALLEERKDIHPQREDAAFDRAVTTPALVQGIRVPILSVVGQYDAFFCTPPSCPEARVEPAVYDCHSQSAGARGVVATTCAPRAELELVVVRNAGHALNWQRNAPAWFALARHWSDRHFGPCPQGCH